MNTVKAQSSPRNATRYFDEHLSHDDYYSDKERTLGRWFGQGCKALGLDAEAPVQKEGFTALCKGLRPDDGCRLTQRTMANRRSLYDLTVSAPKSVSIVALVAGDDRLIAAHEKAVAASLQAAEALAQTRVRKGTAADTKQNRVTGNIVCAQFLHRESRALDPQLHTHCIVFNVTFDPVEKRLKALEARPFYDRAKDLTQVYREHLTQSLRALGYETYQDQSRCVQIRGVDAALLAKFSKRSAQRDALVGLKEQELGRRLSKGEVAKVVHQHRSKKQRQTDPEALRKMQLDQLSPAERGRLQQLKQQALTACTDSRPSVPQPRVALPDRTPAVDWVATIRLAVLVTRTLNVNPYLFSPQFSFPERVCWAARFLHQAHRTARILRYAQRGTRSLVR